MHTISLYLIRVINLYIWSIFDLSDLWQLSDLHALHCGNLIQFIELISRNQESKSTSEQAEKKGKKASKEKKNKRKVNKSKKRKAKKETEEEKLKREKKEAEREQKKQAEKERREQESKQRKEYNEKVAAARKVHLACFHTESKKCPSQTPFARWPMLWPARLATYAPVSAVPLLCPYLGLAERWFLKFILNGARTEVYLRSADMQAPIMKNLDQQRQMLQRARDALQNGIDKYEAGCSEQIRLINQNMIIDQMYVFLDLSQPPRVRKRRWTNWLIRGTRLWIATRLSWKRSKSSELCEDIDESCRYHFKLSGALSPVQCEKSYIVHCSLGLTWNCLRESGKRPMHWMGARLRHFDFPASPYWGNDTCAWHCMATTLATSHWISSQVGWSCHAVQSTPSTSQGGTHKCFTTCYNVEVAWCGLQVLWKVKPVNFALGFDLGSTHQQVKRLHTCIDAALPDYPVELQQQKIWSLLQINPAGSSMS